MTGIFMMFCDFRKDFLDRLTSFPLLLMSIGLGQYRSTLAGDPIGTPVSDHERSATGLAREEKGS